MAKLGLSLPLEGLVDLIADLWRVSACPPLLGGVASHEGIAVDCLKNGRNQYAALPQHMIERPTCWRVGV